MIIVFPVHTCLNTRSLSIIEDEELLLWITTILLSSTIIRILSENFLMIEHCFYYWVWIQQSELDSFIIFVRFRQEKLLLWPWTSENISFIETTIESDFSGTPDWVTMLEKNHVWSESMITSCKSLLKINHCRIDHLIVYEWLDAVTKYFTLLLNYNEYFLLYFNYWILWIDLINIIYLLHLDLIVNSITFVLFRYRRKPFSFFLL
jgi:hypothetical protein